MTNNLMAGDDEDVNFRRRVMPEARNRRVLENAIELVCFHGAGTACVCRYLGDEPFSSANLMPPELARRY
jgi:hypothetical protein